MQVKGHIKKIAKDSLGNTQLHKLVKEGCAEAVKFHIYLGFDIDAKNGLGSSTIHISLRNKQTELARLLVDKGVNINAKDKFGDTALHRASEKPTIEIVQWLIKANANLYIKNNLRKTALQIALENGHIEIVYVLFQEMRGSCLDTYFYSLESKFVCQEKIYIASDGFLYPSSEFQHEVLQSPFTGEEVERTKEYSSFKEYLEQSCPISLEPIGNIKDPVLLACDCCVYEKRCIEKLLNNEPAQSPINRQRFSENDLKPSTFYLLLDVYMNKKTLNHQYFS